MITHSYLNSRPLPTMNFLTTITMKHLKSIILMAVTVLLSASSFAKVADGRGLYDTSEVYQSRRVTVKVSDDLGEIVGANVVVKGTTIGAITDMSGNAVIDGVPNNAVLVVSYVGYVTQEITLANNQNSIEVLLKEDAEVLEEVVVVGYGVQKKSDVTGAISSVKAADLENRTISSADQALQGKTAGVVVMMGSGAPGSSPMIRVRGFSSNASSDPLYVVDGLRVKASDVSGIDPNTIESMEVLKDAASAAIYGAQAGNGVVLITTKKGQQGTSKIGYEFQMSMQSLGKLPKVLNAQDYITYYKEMYASTGSFNDLLAANYDGHTNTSWVDAAFENSKMKRHSLNFNAANDKGSYFLALSYTDNNGIVAGKKDTYERYTLTFNGDYKFKPWLKLTSNVSMDRTKTKNSITEGSLFGGYTSATLMLDPLTPVYTSADNLASNSYMKEVIEGGQTMLGNDNGYYTTSLFYTTDQPHPFVSRDRNDRLSKRFQVRGNIALDLTPIKGLTITSRLGYRLSGSYANNFAYKYTYNVKVYSNFNTVSSSSSLTQYYQWENFANYNFKLGNHNITAMAGVSFDETNISDISGSVNEILKESGLYHYLDYQTNSATRTIGGDDLFTRTFSYFGRLNWDYQGKYMAQFSLRADAADLSKLSKSARWGYFPSASVGWVVSQEPFMQGISSWLPYLKLRGSWGQNGSISGLDSYMWRSAIAQDGFYNLQDATSTTVYTSGMKPSTLGNENLTWETSEQLDLGIDLRFFNSRLAVTMDYFQKKTKDLIVSGAVPSLVVGNTSSPINGGNVENKGFEFELTWKDKIGKDFNYSISGNLATLKNKVTYVSDYVSGKLDGANMNTYTKLTMFEAGYPVWYYNGWTFTGIDSETGYPTFEDKNGDGIISDSDKSYIGSAIPDFTYGVTLNASYKNFDLVVFGTGSQGNKIYQWLNRPDAKGSNILQSYFDTRWTESNRNGTYPSATTPSDLATYYTFSNAMVKDGSFFKVKQIQLGYSLPKNLISKLALSNVRAYVSLEDFFTFTKYDGFDPEATSASTGVKYTGIDAGSYPSSKKVVLGLNVTF